jgi:hypothetical protein
VARADTYRITAKGQSALVLTWTGIASEDRCVAPDRKAMVGPAQALQFFMHLSRTLIGAVPHPFCALCCTIRKASSLGRHGPRETSVRPDSLAEPGLS